MTTTPSQPPAQSWLDHPAVAALRLNWEKIAWIVLLLLALALRLYDLGARTMSHDESLHTLYSYNLYSGVGFRHDPLMHGPLLFHMSALSYFLFGASDFSARLWPVVTGVGLVGLMWFARPWMGRLGAFIAALFLAVSPMLLFHSRYIRHDMSAIFFAVAIIVTAFRFIQTGQGKWLVWMAVSLAFLYITKEVSYIYAMIVAGFFLVWLAIKLISQPWTNKALKWPFFILLALGAILVIYPMNEALHAPVDQLVRSPRFGNLVMWPVLLVGFGMVLVSLFLLWRGFSEEKLREMREVDVVVWLVTLSAPLFAAFPIKIFGGNPQSISIVGNALQPNVLLAAAIFLIMVLVFGAVGFIWGRQRYLASLGLFYAIMLLFFTTFFTNGNGIATGLVGSMGYWLAQQAVQRGSQPGFYYFMIVPLYEYVPLLLSLLAGIAIAWRAIRRRPLDPTGDDSASAPAFRSEWLLFLVWWTLATWGAYTWAGEKMPWLATHFAVPMAILGGWFLAERLKLVDWIKARSNSAWWLMLAVPLWLLAFIAFLRLRPFGGSDLDSLSDTMAWIASLALLVGLGLVIVRKMRSVGGRLSRQLTFLSLLGVLSLMWLRTGLYFNYVNYDLPVEPGVYAHGTPDIKIVVDQIAEISRRTVGEGQLAFAYDNESTWPFEWYFRDFPNKKFFGATPSRDYLKDTPVVIVGTENEGKVKPFLGNEYYRVPYRQIWWPKETYKGITLDQIMQGLRDPQIRQNILDIILYRRYQQPLADWDPSDRFVMFVRKDIAAQVWDLGAAPAAVAEAIADPFADKYQLPAATQLVGGINGAGPGQMQQPRNLAVATDGRIYALDSGNHRVQVFNPDGSFAFEFGGFGDQPGQFNEPWGIAIGPDGRVYIADTWNHRIQVFDPEGQLVNSWGGFVSTDGQLGQMGVFWGPRGVAFDPTGNVLVTDTGNKRVQVFDAEGNALTQFGGAGLDVGYFDEPVGIAVDADGYIYVADTWNRRVQKFTPDYQFAKEWAVPGWEGEDIFAKPFIAADDQGNIIASDPTGWRLFVWDREGNAIYTIGQFGTSATDFGLPNGVAIGPDQALWVADAENHRLMRFDALP